jgi:pyruvate kinase
MLRRMFEAGMDVARLNFSHGTHEDHARAYRLLRELGPCVAVMQDLQGPKIRLGALPAPGVKIEAGQEVVLSVADDPGGDVPLDYPPLPREVGPGDDIFVADGVIHLQVERAQGDRIFCRVLHGGLLASRKGVNLPGARISSPALTARDREDLAFGLGLGVDYVALSFVRSAEEVAELRGLIAKAGSKAGVVAKIEKREALDDVEAILEQADAVMIARGDLGVEIPIEQVPFVQKRLINRCLQAGKPVITATQMLESMVGSELPTRAETSDVANAILDGSDAVMLSAETAAGRAPDRTVEIMRRIIEAAEGYAIEGQASGPPAGGVGGGELDALTDAVCAGAVETAAQVKAKAIAALTHTGRTARYIARRRPNVPILALTDDPGVVGRISLVWGTQAIPIDRIDSTEAMLSVVRERVSRAGFNGTVVVTAGIPTRERRATNTVHVMDI